VCYLFASCAGQVHLFLFFFTFSFYPPLLSTLYSLPSPSPPYSWTMLEIFGVPRLTCSQPVGWHRCPCVPCMSSAIEPISFFSFLFSGMSDSLISSSPDLCLQRHRPLSSDIPQHRIRGDDSAGDRSRASTGSQGVCLYVFFILILVLCRKVDIGSFRQKM
jgi:hypothetical protein